MSSAGQHLMLTREELLHPDVHSQTVFKKRLLHIRERLQMQRERSERRRRSKRMVNELKDLHWVVLVVTDNAAVKSVFLGQSKLVGNWIFFALNCLK
jgi:hypothetical protein